MTTFKIEKRIPIPTPKKTGYGSYPFADMKVGDSFFVPSSDTFRETRLRVASAASYYGLRHPGIKFSLRKTDDGIRVWRVA